MMRVGKHGCLTVQFRGNADVEGALVGLFTGILIYGFFATIIHISDTCESMLKKYLKKRYFLYFILNAYLKRYYSM